MEALVAASAAALALYDMCKAADKGIVIRAGRAPREDGRQERKVAPEGGRLS